MSSFELLNRTVSTQSNYGYVCIKSLPIHKYFLHIPAFPLQRSFFAFAACSCPYLPLCQLPVLFYLISFALPFRGLLLLSYADPVCSRSPPISMRQPPLSSETVSIQGPRNKVFSAFEQENIHSSLIWSA